MKIWKTCLTLLLCLALLLSLAACGSFEQKMLRAASKMEKLESYHTDAEVELALSVSLMGQSMAMDMTMNAASDVQNDPRRVFTAARTELMGETVEVLSYFFAGEDGGMDAYVSTDGGESWESRTMTQDEISGFKLDGDLQWSYLSESAKSFEEVGKEEINGSQATRFDGVIEGEAVGKAVEASGILDSLGDTFPLDLSETFDELSGSMPVSLWVDDKSGMIVRYDMDMTEVFASVWDSMLVEIMESEELGELGGLDELGLSMTLEKTFVSVTISNFDAVGEIVLPDAAKAA